MTTETRITHNDTRNIYQIDIYVDGLSADGWTEYATTEEEANVKAAEMLADWNEANAEVEEMRKFDMRQVEELTKAMTPAEIEREFHLAPGTVRQAVNRNSIPHRRPDERTILIHRADAVERWGKPRKIETRYTYYTIPLHDFTVAEIERGEAGEVSGEIITVPVYEGGDANNPVKVEVDVKVVAPVGYRLTDKDYGNIDELLADER